MGQLPQEAELAVSSRVPLGKPGAVQVQVAQPRQTADVQGTGLHAAGSAHADGVVMQGRRVSHADFRAKPTTMKVRGMQTGDVSD